jgi:transcriptional regulator with XRE-family HTH domain
MKRVTNIEIAEALGCGRSWVSQVLNGHARAPEKFKHGLAAMLDEPVEALFIEDARTDPTSRVSRPA